MTIFIYFDEAKKNVQIIRPKYPPACNIKDIVDTVTCSEDTIMGTDLDTPKRNYHSFEVIQ